MAMAHDDRTVDMIRSRLDRPIVMTGMMGSGKSRLGRMLADILDVPFRDSDDEIEKAADCSIAEIFERYGEPFFRDREKRIISRLLDNGKGVIATGGGAVMQPETAAAIRDRSISIWMKADMPVLLERVGRGANRPLLKDGNPEEILTRLAAERDPVYAQADIIVESHNGPAVAILNSMIQKLDHYLSRPRKVSQS